MHRTIGMTPAMAAGVCETLCSMDDLVAMVDRFDDALPRQKPGRKPKTQQSGS
jgi:hypothetical protein